MSTQRQKEQLKRSPINPEDRILAELFQTEQGVRALNYLGAIFYDNSTFVQDDRNTNFIMYKIGQQDVIGFIRETINEVNRTPSGLMATGGQG